MAYEIRSMIACACSVLAMACTTGNRPPAALPGPEYRGVDAPPAPVIVEREPGAREILEDEAIASAVRSELAELGAEPECGLLPIDVEVERGVVVLEGTVPTLLHAAVARERAETVRGVRGVVNRLRVPPLPVTDREIEGVIRSRIEEEPALRGSSIEVASQLGRVRLRGSVASYTEKELAQEIARGVGGVREVNSDITISPQPRTDDDIQKDIAARLANDAYLADDVVDVEVDSGRVSLSGAVGSFMEKRRAVTQAWVSGVVGVEDARVVVDLGRQDRDQRQARPRPSDADVARAVRDALWIDPDVLLTDLDVTVNAGIARIRGVVSNLRAKRAAERDAEHAVGVWRVESSIVVRPPTPMADVELEERVRTRVSEALRPGAPRLEILVEEGRVIVRGTIDDPVNRLAVIRSIEQTPGVLELVDELATSETRPAKSDARLERDIARGLWWDPRVDSASVDVDVRDGVAVVKGQVPSRATHDAVMENVWQAGPRSVNDRLELARD